MKKLLILLSVLTISGNALPITITDSYYKKQENKLNNIEINYKTTNNLENLSLIDYLEFNNKYIKKISDKSNIFINDNQNNIYFGIKNELFLLKKDEEKSNKITEVSTNDIIFLEVDSKNNIYIGTNNKLFSLKTGQTAVNLINGIDRNSTISFITIDNNDNVYIGTSNDAYFLKKSETTATLIGEINNDVYSIISDNNNNVYFVTRNSIYILKFGKNKLIQINNIIDNNIHSIIFDNNNNVYFATGSKFFSNNNNNNIYIIKNGETIANKINFNFSGVISKLAIDSKNNIYIGTNNGLYILKQNETQTNKIKELNEFIFSITIDKNDNVFISTDLGIRVFQNNRILKLINKKSNIYYNNLVKIIKNDNVFIKINNFLYCLCDINLVKFKKVKEAPSSSIDLIEIDSKDNIYIGTNYNLPQFFKKDENIAHYINGIIDHKVFSIAVDKNDNVYIGTINGLFILKDGEKTAKRIDLTIETVNKINFDKNDNVYITADTGAYILENNNKLTKINGINNKVYSTAFDSKNNVYFGTSDGAYVLKSGEKTAKKINNIQNYVVSLIIDKNDNIYFITEKKQRLSSFISNHKIFILKQGNNKQIKLNGIDENTRGYKLIIDKNNNIYIFTSNGLFILKDGKTIFEKINGINIDQSSKAKFDSENNMYIANYEGLFILKDGESKITKINGINEWVNNFVFDINNDIIFIDRRIRFGFLENKILINSSIKNLNLKQINNNDDETILNIINYLNRENNYFLNLNKMKIINKTSTSATIEAIKGKYRGQFTVNYKIKNKDEIITIDLNDLLQKAIYFDFIDKNFYSIDKIKEIKEINSNNLNFGNVEVTRDSKLSRIVHFKAECLKKTFTNISSKDTQKRKVPKCDYSTKSKLIFQIIIGLIKINQENKLNIWNINLDDEIKLSDFININNKYHEIINTLSDIFDLSNTNKQEQEMILQSFNEDDYEISIDPKNKLEIKYSVREINLKTILNLKQKITGIITAKIINDNNEEKIITLSIKEAMKILQKYSLLPDEITINEDNSVTFNGKAKISLVQEAEPQLITKISNI